MAGEDKKDDKDKDEELVMVGEDGKPVNDPGADEADEDGKDEKGKKPKKDEPDEEDDDRSGRGRDDDDEEEGDERRAGGDERVGRESTEAEERRAQRQEKKRRQREAKDRTYRELDFLRRRNEQLERRFSEMEARTGTTELAAIDSRISQLKGHIAEAERVMAEAVKQSKGDDLVEATRIKDDLVRNLNHLTTVRQQAERAQKEGPRREVPVELVAHAEEWQSAHPWYKHGGRDPDSRTVMAIDNAMVREGIYDPTTPEYWEELTKRAAKRLPHRFKSKARDEVDDDIDLDDDEDEVEERPASRKKNGGNGPRFSTGGRERPLRKNEVYVSPDRISALKELGVWDDPVLRKKYLKAYRNYDREHASNSRG